jgi:hypothetical protein
MYTTWLTSVCIEENDLANICIYKSQKAKFDFSLSTNVYDPANICIHNVLFSNYIISTSSSQTV